MGLFDVFKKGKSGAGARGPLVYVNPGSRVYHHDGLGCCSGVSADASAMPEAGAVAAGLSRCRRCEWYAFDWEAGNGRG